jgi:hypothetical protein
MSDYKWAEHKALDIFVTKYYGSQNALARELDISRQAVQQWFTEKRIPLPILALLCRKHGYTPGIFRYKEYVLMGGDKDYMQLVSAEKGFAKFEKEEILRGDVPTKKEILDEIGPRSR